MLRITKESASWASTDLWKVEGLDAKELDELNSMDYRDMKDKVLDILDSREHNHWNKRLGTTWQCGNGVYTAYIRDGAVYLEVGKSCD